MNNASPEKKNSILKTLAITGFLAIIIIIAWLSIQLVSALPNAYTSLASLAEGVSQYQQSIVEPEAIVPLVVTSNTTLVNSGGNVEVSWNTAQASGSYTFAYECADGVSVDLVSDGGMQSIDCDSNYNLGDTDSVTLAIDSAKNRYADVTYSISFLETDGASPRATGDATLTVVNNNVSNLVIATEEATEVAVEPEVAVVEEVSTQPEAAEVVETTPTPETVSTPPVFEQEFVYTIPTSDPNGRVDLATKFIITGAISGNTFNAGIIDEDEAGAIQFEVKNLGSKTSEDWTFTVSLPNGSTYQSDNQEPLKPNERAVLTIGFQPAEVASHTFEVEVETVADRNNANNTFLAFTPFF